MYRQKKGYALTRAPFVTQAPRRGAKFPTETGRSGETKPLVDRDEPEVQSTSRRAGNYFEGHDGAREQGDVFLVVR
ncbi:hypothetical protein BJP06_03575 [Corynebacterium sp. NML120713]|nr:hypothetical protein BJP06_03575 [Corynebacterium sp. NML120713]